MQTILIVTTFRGLDSYAQTMLDSFASNGSKK